MVKVYFIEAKHSKCYVAHVFVKTFENMLAKAAESSDIRGIEATRALTRNTVLGHTRHSPTTLLGQCRFVTHEWALGLTTSNLYLPLSEDGEELTADKKPPLCRHAFAVLMGHRVFFASFARYPGQ